MTTIIPTAKIKISFKNSTLTAPPIRKDKPTAPKTKRIIQYRVDNPEWALSDIANAYNEEYNDNMSKSSVRTILMKVMQLAEDANHG